MWILFKGEFLGSILVKYHYCTSLGKDFVLNSFGLNNIHNVLYVPHLNTNLLSVGKFMLDKYSLLFEESTSFFIKTN